ncbi:hypothetical protein QP735_14860, partial [Curtobacterium citreum]
MADDLDWNAIIAPGDDADGRKQPAVRPDDIERPTSADQPLSRREARAAEAARGRRDGDDADSTRPTSPADAPVAQHHDELHPEVRALLTGEVPADAARNAGLVGGAAA